MTDLKAIIKRNREFVTAYKKLNGCESCGHKSHPKILRFHHIEKKESKMSGVNILMKRLASIERIEAEIIKCELLCPNCYAIKRLKQVYQSGTK